VTVVSYGREVNFALEAAEVLAGDGIDVEVVDLRWLSPMDTDTVLASVAKTKRAVIFHQAVRRGGVGAEIATLINEELFGELATAVRRVAAPNVPVPYNKVLEQAYAPSAEKIQEAVRAVVKDAPTSS